MEPQDFSLSGERVLSVEFSGKVQLVSREISAAGVFAYGRPDGAIVEREALIETFSLGGTSIIHDEDRVSVFLDISQLQMPPFCQFHFFRVVADEDMDNEVLELAGLENLWVKGKMREQIVSDSQMLEV